MSSEHGETLDEILLGQRERVAQIEREIAGIGKTFSAYDSRLDQFSSFVDHVDEMRENSLKLAGVLDEGYGLIVQHRSLINKADRLYILSVLMVGISSVLLLCLIGFLVLYPTAL